MPNKFLSYSEPKINYSGKKTSSLWQSGTSPDWTTRISVQSGQNVICKRGQKVARGHPTMEIQWIDDHPPREWVYHGTYLAELNMADMSPSW